MSELSTFVAAVLRDRVVSELIAELNLLRAWKHDSEAVMITGPDRTPVYAHGHLSENGANYSHPLVHEPLWKVTLSQINSCSLHDSAVIGVEIWVNNMRLCSAAEFVQLVHLGQESGRLTWQGGPRDNLRFIMSGAIDGWTDQAMRFTQNAGPFDILEMAEFVRNDLAPAYPNLGCNFTCLVMERGNIRLLRDPSTGNVTLRHEERQPLPLSVFIDMP
jgi:hypothetical protein